MATIEGQEIDLMPTKGMREEAQRYRDWKADGEDGGTEVAARRASQILSGDELSPDVVITMAAWFARHEVDKQGEGFSPGEDGYPSAGRVAWAAWGGDPGQSWAEQKADRIKALQDREMEPLQDRAAPNELSVGDFVQWESGGGTARGKIDSIERDGSINVPNSEFTISGTEEDPAALITVYREGEDGWAATDVQVGHKFSTLNKIAELRDMPGIGRHQRAELTTFDEVDDRIYEFPFSSEYPVARYFGNEILSHEMDAADLSRLNDGAPLLFNHNPDRVIGVVERAYINGKKKRGYARVRFSRNAFAQEVLSDVKDGVLRNVSFGYSIDKMEERGSGDFVATAWSPYEVSVVSVPADPGVGIGRSLEAEQAASAAPTPDPIPAMETNTTDLAVVRAEAAEAERSRIAGITALCDKHGMGDIGRQMIESGRSIDEARAAVLDKLGAKPIEAVKPVELEQRDAANYSISEGIRAALSGDWSSREAGLVKEISQEVQRTSGFSQSGKRGFFVPFSALSKRATYVTSGATTGGNLVATDLMADEFIEALRNQSVMLNLGIRTMTGLVGDVAIPRRSGVASTYYLSTETTAITQSESTFDQVTLQPKNLAALSKYSRQTLLQATPGIEELVRRDLTDGINLGIDLGILNGSGSSGQPTGILNTSGIGSVAIGTNGGPITVDALVDLEEQVLIDNGAVNRDAIGYVTNAKVLAELKKLRAGGSTTTDGAYLVNDQLNAIGRGGTPASVNGYPLYVTNQVPSNLTKGTSSGVCSAVLMGDFSQAMVGFWGNGLEIVVGEDSDDFSKALTSVRAIVTYDVAVRHAESFAAILDVTT
jgi:HK97 family phage major capsid protein/HK97 family phage prohead protease